MESSVIIANVRRELSKAREEHPNARVHMYEERSSPGIDVNIILLDPQESDVSVVWNVGDADAGHLPDEECESEKQKDVETNSTIEISLGLG